MEYTDERSLPYDKDLSFTLNEIKRQIHLVAWLEANNENASIPFRQFRGRDTVYQELVEAIELTKEEDDDTVNANNLLKLELLKDAIDEDNYAVFREIYCDIQREIVAMLLSSLPSSSNVETLQEIERWEAFLDKHLDMIKDKDN